ncbi:NADPH-dependent 7-cyano-7-deazaguanine reductase [Streptomyces sp. NPDC048527]|uniref:preQ(1) synthase n=1 Tax=Streptomyces sp. NPDC048527 TaxID=3365568 RepID=UPI00370FAB6F
MTAPPTYLGRHLRRPLAADEMATSAEATIPAPPHLREVVFTSMELSSNCPITGQPDLYTATISYSPTGGLCLESKALKHYLWSFRDKGVFAEDLASQIAEDLHMTLNAAVNVELIQQVRGGLELTVRATAPTSGTPA